MTLFCSLLHSIQFCFIPSQNPSAAQMSMFAPFHEHGIVPKILPSLPTEVLGLTYDHGNKVQPGAAIPRSDTLQAPFIHYSQPGEYLVVMVGRLRAVSKFIRIGDSSSFMPWHAHQAARGCRTQLHAGKFKFSSITSAAKTMRLQVSGRCKEHR
jgi:hypothetical protein